MLYPREDKTNRKLLFACRNCHFEEDADNNCVYRHEIVHAPSYVHGSDLNLSYCCNTHVFDLKIREQTMVLTDLSADPTLVCAEYVQSNVNDDLSLPFQSYSLAPLLLAPDADIRKLCSSSLQLDEQIQR
jgi:hypothetical protein